MDNTTDAKEGDAIVIEGLAERLAEDVQNHQTGEYAMWELPDGNDTKFKRVERLTDDETAYLAERLHWLAAAALNQISVITGTKFAVVLDHFVREVNAATPQSK